MKEEEYEKELDIIMERLKKAHKDNNPKEISKCTTQLNKLWEKGSTTRFQAMIKDGFIPPTKN